MNIDVIGNGIGLSKIKYLFKKLFDDDEEIKRKTSAMYQYYSHDEEKQYGVIGIKISLVK